MLAVLSSGLHPWLTYYVQTDTSGETEKSYRLLQQEMQKMRWQPESSGPLELAGSQESYVHES